MRNKGLRLAYPNIKDTFDKIPFDSNTILYNDNGSEYTSNKMKALIKKLGIKHSFTKFGTGFQDNSIVEYLFSIWKKSI